MREWRRKHAVIKTPEPDLPGELWKPWIDDEKLFENYIEVSTKGRIRSIERTILVTSGLYEGVERRFKSKILAQPLTVHGRKSVRLNFKGRYHIVSSHRLVAQTFIPNPENKPEVNHIDGNPLNNVIENLEWCTHVENCIHRNQVLGHCTGEKNGSSKLTRVTVRAMRDAKIAGLTALEIAEKFNSTLGNVRHVIWGKTWRGV